MMREPENIKKICEFASELIFDTATNAANQFQQTQECADVNKCDLMIQTITNVFSHCARRTHPTFENELDLVWNFIIQVAAVDPNRYMPSSQVEQNVNSLIKQDEGVTNLLARLLYSRAFEFKEANALLTKNKKISEKQRNSMKMLLKNYTEIYNDPISPKSLVLDVQT